MTGSIGITNSTQAVATFAPLHATPVSSTTSGASASVPAPPAQTNVVVHNPRVINDPSAGFITEYLSNNGSEVVSQTPSAVAVAYLRQGLTADGSTKAEAAHAGTVTA